MTEIEIVLPVGKMLRQADAEAAARKKFGRADCTCVIAKRSIDARKDVVCRWKVEVWFPEDDYKPFQLPDYQDVSSGKPVIVVGSGPAGMFAALRLLMLGLKPVVLERGKDVHARKFDMAKLSRDGVVNPDSNYCFGEGGAGTFSDGKLYTRSSKRGDNREVLYQLVRFGANPDILIDAHAHIGSDKLPVVVENIRKCVVEHGGEYHFESRVDSFRRGDDGLFTVHTSDGREYVGHALILATGHSARDVYEMLDGMGGKLEAKGFALGVRVEHPQEKINYSRYHGQWKPGMPAAEYSFVEQQDGRGVFSFCMCPGGILVPSSTEPETVVLNGMSNSARNSKWANSGVVVQIEPEDVPQKYSKDGAFALMNYQRDIERKMYDYVQKALFEDSLKPHRKMKGTKQDPDALVRSENCNLMAAPAQRMEDFCQGKMSKSLPESSYHPGIVSAPLHELLPANVAERLRKVFPRVTIRNYYTNAALLLGVESRTSSPVRIPRDPETLQYESFPGVFPSGEGAGYSGGIVSSAIDGIRCANAVADLLGTN